MEDIKCKNIKLYKDEENNNSLDLLKDIFNNINSWLNFAEAKNGALIGINGLFLFESVDYLFDILNGNLNSDFLITVGLMVSVFLLVMLIALRSFFPNTSNDASYKISREKNISNANNILIFYGDISNYNSAELYLKDIYKYYIKTKVETEDLQKIEVDYATEILINSKITSYKYKCFKNAIKIYFIGVFIFAIFIFLA